MKEYSGSLYPTYTHALPTLPGRPTVKSVSNSVKLFDWLWKTAKLKAIALGYIEPILPSASLKSCNYRLTAKAKSIFKQQLATGKFAGIRI